MSIWTSPAAMSLRRFGRTLGVNRILGSALQRAGYEARFGRALLQEVRPGDCVWDIGANVGLYTERFSAEVGDGGHVVAFEPSPINRVALEGRLARRGNVSISHFALGNRNEAAALAQGEDDVGATSRIVDGERPTGRGAIPVEIRTADELLRLGLARSPNVIKIDTEGFELGILEGMAGALRDSRLRVMGVEIHFALLARSGRGDAPARIESLLRSAGFDLRWTDASHVIATRRHGPTTC